MNRGIGYGAVAVGIAALVGVGAVLYDNFSERSASTETAAPDLSVAPAAGPESDSGNGAAAAPAAEPAMPVEAAPVQVDTVTAEIEAVGTLQSNESVVLGPEIDGRIAEILFREGEAVEKGKVLVRLDTEILEAELAQARANLILSEANYERANTLANQGTGTVRARDEALAQMQTDRANLILAEVRLENASIRAPFEGVLGLRSVSVGAYVRPGDRIVNIEQIDPLKVDFRVAEVFLPNVRVGQKIDVTVDALPGEIFRGQIYAIDPQVDVSGRAIRLRARIPNPEGRLSPGLFARVSIIVEQRENAVLVPEAALVPQQDGKFVYRIEDNKALLTKVEVGRRLPGQVEILEGLGPDAVVVTAGQQRLRDGAPVDVVEPVEPVAGA
ncbi:efflux RND transporter periplasmic adaptor subunit [Rhodospirillaceae bacterium SYSU D60014]|uniref:efflux RND transporter periplasmic adaptor subunit n=1 Tax=Virgifigura deserti TaxID=2268457 RepID=UPI000E665956